MAMGCVKAMPLANAAEGSWAMRATENVRSCSALLHLTTAQVSGVQPLGRCAALVYACIPASASASRSLHQLGEQHLCLFTVIVGVFGAAGITQAPHVRSPYQSGGHFTMKQRWLSSTNGLQSTALDRPKGYALTSFGSMGHTKV